MTLINLKFSPEMKQALLEGRKCCTSRKTKKGDVGDVFVIDGRLYRILHVHMIGLHPLTYVYYDIEGFETPEEFCKFWENYNQGPVDWQSEAVVHFFAYVGDVSE
jgi:hypothetical protein